MCPTPPCIVCFPVYLYILGGICGFYGQNTSYVGGLGVSAHLSGFWCLSVYPLDIHYASSCAFLVVYYVSSLYYHGYNYYSSSDCGVFWYVISIISDCGSHFNGASYNIGSALCGSATTPDTKMLWTCSWPCLCATAATSIYNASSGLCQLCHGFYTGRFLFQSWASHHFAYTFGVCSGVCFLLSGALLDAILTSRGSTIGVCTIATPWSSHGRHMHNLVMVIGPHWVCTEWLLPPLHWVGGSFCYSVCCSAAIPSIWWGIQLWGLSRESPNLSTFPAWWGGVLFSRFGSIQWHSWLWICDGH